MEEAEYARQGLQEWQRRDGRGVKVHARVIRGEFGRETSMVFLSVVPPSMNRLNWV